MDDRVTYGNGNGTHAGLYLVDADLAPDTLTLKDGTRLIRLSDISLECEKLKNPGRDPDNPKRTLPTGCGGYDCHRQKLGSCQCGYHQRPSYRPIERPQIP